MITESYLHIFKVGTTDILLNDIRIHCLQSDNLRDQSSNQYEAQVYFIVAQKLGCWLLLITITNRKGP